MCRSGGDSVVKIWKGMKGDTEEELKTPQASQGEGVEEAHWIGDC